MPTRLPTGVLIYNLTPHNLYFKTDAGTLTAPSDGILNALPVNRVVEKREEYELTAVDFVKMHEGMALLRRIRDKDDDALLIGSNIAAKTYEGVVAPVPCFKGTARQDKRLIRPDLFTIYT